MAVPDPVADPVSVIHEALVDEPQLHPNCVVTAIVPVPPAAGTVTLSGLTDNVHDALGCLMTKLFPAIDMMAIRDSVVVLGATVNAKLPEPEPLVGLETVTHDAPPVAVQLHPAVVVTVAVPLPPAADIDRPLGEMVYEQGVAAWLTVSVLPPTVTVPVRATVPVFGATV